MTKLLPCPHCGKPDPRSILSGYGPSKTRDIECDRCGASAPESVWNTRVPVLSGQPNPGRLVDILRNVEGRFT